MKAQSLIWLALISCKTPEVVDTDSGSDTADTDTADTDVAQDLTSCAIDIHQHFSQSSTFFDAGDDLIAKMAATQVGEFQGTALAMVMPPPESGLSDLGSNYTYTDDMSPSIKYMTEENPSKFALVAGGGILNPWIHEASDSARALDTGERASFKNAAQSILTTGGAIGFGEMAILHISYAASHPFIFVQPDHDLYLALAEVAAENGVPIDIHLEAVDTDSFAFPADMVVPGCWSNVDSGGENPTTLPENISGFETLLDHNLTQASSPADAKIIWTHVGWDNTGDMDVELLDRLLDEHSNLYLGLKMLDELGPCQSETNRPLDGDGNLQAEWLTLFQEHPTRFVLGSDEFVGGDEEQTTGSPSTQGTWDLIGELPDDLALAFACDNPRRLFNLDDD